MAKVCVIGASGKLGRYLVTELLGRGDEVVAVCRPQSVLKLNDVADRVSIVPGFTNEREVIEKAVAGCDGVLTVLVPWGVQQYATGTAQAVLDFARNDARLIFSVDGTSQGTGKTFTRDPCDSFWRSSVGWPKRCVSRT